MKFQDSSLNGLKVTVGTKCVTHARTHAPKHAPKALCPINFFKVGGITSNRKAMNRNRSNQKANPALKTKTGNK